MVEEWISWDTASELTGIKVPTIEHAVRVGRIERRPRRGNHPSLRRDSVLAWADWYRDVDLRRLAANEGRARDRGLAPERPPGWLTTQEAGRRLTAATRNCLETATKLPAGGHEKCPVAAMRSARHDVVCLTASRG